MELHSLICIWMPHQSISDLHVGTAAQRKWVMHYSRPLHPSPQPSLGAVLLYIHIQTHAMSLNGSLKWLLRLETEKRRDDRARLMWRNSCILMNPVTTALSRKDVARYRVLHIHQKKDPSEFVSFCIWSPEDCSNRTEHLALWAPCSLRRRWGMRRRISWMFNYTRKPCHPCTEPPLAGTSHPPRDCSGTVHSTSSNWLPRC